MWPFAKKKKTPPRRRMLKLTTHCMHHHLLVAGLPGSGKTNWEKALICNVARLSDGDPGNHVAVVLDTANEMPAQIAGMWPKARVTILNPFDTRSTELLIGKELRGRGDLLELAAKVIPSERQSHEHFPLSAQRLFKGVAENLARRGGGWRLHHVFQILRDPTLTKKILNLYPDDHKATLDLLEKRDSAMDVQQTLHTKLSRLEPTVAAASRSTEKREFRDLLESPVGEVVLMGVQDRNSEALGTYYSLILDVFVDLILEAQRRGKTIWFFLDEIRALAALKAYQKIGTRGRKSGCAVLTFVQNFHGLRERYGPQVAKEIIAAHTSLAFLRCDEDAAGFGSKMFGDGEFLETIDTPRDWTVNVMDDNAPPQRSVKRRPIVPKEKFMNLPMADYENDRLEGIMFSPWHRGYFRMRFRHAVDAADPTVKDFLPRPVEDQYLPSLTPQDWKDMKIDPMQEGA